MFIGCAAMAIMLEPEPNILTCCGCREWVGERFGNTMEGEEIEYDVDVEKENEYKYKFYDIEKSRYNRNRNEPWYSWRGTDHAGVFQHAS